MEPVGKGEPRDDPAESGALEDEGEGTPDPPSTTDEPVESGALDEAPGGDG